jgi:hypothetical protein
MPINQQLRSRGVTDKTLLPAVNDEILPVLGAAREALNRQLVLPPALAIDSGALAIDWTLRRNYKLALSENVTSISFTDPVDAGWYALKVTQGAAFTMASWPSSVIWVGGGVPVITATAGRVDILEFYFDGTEYVGRAEQDAS